MSGCRACRRAPIVERVSSRIRTKRGARRLCGATYTNGTVDDTGEVAAAAEGVSGGVYSERRLIGPDVFDIREATIVTVVVGDHELVVGKGGHARAERAARVPVADTILRHM